ncbi:hypothetical protein [Rhodococcus sp. 1168]|uniref:phage terminase large subunit family protein n=1 Tax=Rhodococcus sp. 1168 TaxID=2018041 RepID=UPI00159455AB|nr:hypothetical protein [Rhodococcus sp. 1168]
MNDTDQSLSSSADNTNERDSVIELLSLQELATQRSDHTLTTELTSDNAPETDLKFDNSINPMSTTLTNTNDFEKVEHTELVKLGLVDEPNRAEHLLDKEKYVSDTLELDAELQWVEQQNIDVHYYPAIVVDDDGNEQSWWPESKSIQELNKQRHTNEFKLNMMNKPVDLSGAYWNADDISIAEPADGYKFTIISVDPAVTSAKSSDYTGLAVLSLGYDGLVYVRHAEQLRIVSTELLEHVNELVEQFEVSVVVVETNQGGDVWRDNVFDGLKAKFLGIRQQEKKEIRISRSLDYYRKQQVVHTRHFSALEAQMYSYPKTKNDDLCDSVATGIHCLLSSSGGMSIKKRSYT